MATTTQNTPSFEEKIKAQVDDAKEKLDQLHAKAREKGTGAETATVAKLNSAKQDIDRKLQDLKTAHQGHVTRAKSEIETDTAKFKASVDGFAAKFKGSKT
jgi:hypothetical protein